MKQLFVVAPHFPPSSLPPAQRARLMVNHLHKLGYHPVVFTTFPRYREEEEDQWMNELLTGPHEKIEVKALPQRLTRKFGIGDLGLRMLPYLFIALVSARKKRPVFTIYLVPPWYLMIIAPWVKWLTGVPYAIDFIDPWVAGSVPVNAGMKKKISQWIAGKLEGWVTRNADYIYAVSQPINEDLQKRHPELKGKPFKAVPYGVEVTDYKNKQLLSVQPNEQVTIRYIGAVWHASYPVLEAILKVFGEIRKERSFRMEFIGTSYANRELARPQLEKFVKKFDLSGTLIEIPDRRPYQEAMKLTMQADILLLFGDLSKRYAASKLMGLVASGKPFLAFLHKETSPYSFLKAFNYPFLIGYTADPGDRPEDHLRELREVAVKLLREYQHYQPLDQKDPRFLKHTAEGMIKEIMEPIDNMIQKNGRSHQ